MKPAGGSMPAEAEQRRRGHALGERQRRAVAAERLPHGDRVLPAEAGAAHRLRRQGERQAERLRFRPERFRPFAALGGAQHVGAGAVREQPVHLLDQDAAQAAALVRVAHGQRSPSWRAMMPRRISRVPPRSE